MALFYFSIFIKPLIVSYTGQSVYVQQKEDARETHEKDYVTCCELLDSDIIKQLISYHWTE
jgi:hypothetical protein